MHRFRLLSSCLIVTALLLAACSETPPSPAPGDEGAAAPPPVADAAPPAEGTPRLVVLIAVDQMRADYLDRFDSLFTGGLRRLLDEGVVFSDAHHDHAGTLTAPGHATLASGRHPSRHGVIGNAWWDRETGEEIYCVEDPEHGISARNLRVDTLGDWLKARYPAGRVFSAAGKDRAAVLMGGHQADGVFWYDRKRGGFRAGPAYPALTAWAAEFNAERRLDSQLGKAWDPRPIPPSDYAGRQIFEIDLGVFAKRTPYVFGGGLPAAGPDFYADLYASPWNDANLGDFALRLVEAEDLGGDVWPDLLTLGFSSTDTVGHHFGPNSREILDTLLGLDRILDEFLELLDARIGLDRVVVALSADHGVMPIPELEARRGRPGRRIGADEQLCVQRTDSVLDERFGARDWFQYGLYLDREVLAESGIDRAAIDAAVVEHLAACPSVEAVWTSAELAATGGEASEDEASPGFARLYAHSFDAERSPDYDIQWRRELLAVTTIATSHGSPYPDDTHVPWIVRAAGLVPHRVDRRVHTVDIAPTLAGLVGLEAPADVDGADRAALLEP